MPHIRLLPIAASAACLLCSCAAPASAGADADALQLADPAALETLIDLQWASRERHLPAFERCVVRGGTPCGGGGGDGAGHGTSNSRKTQLI